MTTSTTARVNGRAQRYVVTAPLRKQLVDNHLELDGAHSRLRQLVHRPETASPDSLVDHLAAAWTIVREILHVVDHAATVNRAGCRRLGSLPLAEQHRPFDGTCRRERADRRSAVTA